MIRSSYGASSSQTLSKYFIELIFGVDGVLDLFNNYINRKPVLGLSKLWISIANEASL